MQALDSAGGLNTSFDFKPRQLAAQLTKAKKVNSKKVTTYGRVVEEMRVQIAGRDLDSALQQYD